MWQWVTSRAIWTWSAGGAAVAAASIAAILVVEAAEDEALWAGRVGIVGTVATITGLTVALRQLFRTATAAEASREAARDAERRTTAALAFSLVDHLPAIDREMDTALQGSREELLRIIHQWRQTAAELLRLITTLDPEERAFARRLQLSIALATACSHGLTTPGPPVPEGRIRAFRSAVGGVCHEIPQLKAHLVTTSGGGVA